MGLAEPKMRGKKIAQSWLAQRHRETMLNTSITQAPSLAIGMKLMSKMGWKDGQGLGASEQGIVEPIQLKQTINNKGLGYSRVTGLEQMHYSAHFERFESVLASLGDQDQSTLSELNNTKTEDKTKINKSKKDLKQNATSANNSNSSEGSSSSSSRDDKSSPVEESGPLKKSIKKSLENLSRNVRGRVHYQKFTRGKDVSRYSENDLACILGAKAHTLYTASMKDKREDAKFVFGSLDSKAYFSGLSTPSGTPSESLSPSDSDEPKTFTPSYPINNVLSDEEENLRPTFGGLGFGAVSNNTCEEDGGSRSAFGEVRSGGDDDALQKCFQHRFAAQYMSAFVKADEGLTGTLNTETEEEKNSEDSINNDNNGDNECAGIDANEPEKEAKKKRKKSNCQVKEESQPEVVELVDDPLSKKKNKESKKERNNADACAPLPSEKECCEDEKKDAPVREKSKKKSKAVEDKFSVILENIDLECYNEKKKKKKRKRENVGELHEVPTGQNTSPSDDDVPAPKKKKSKRKSETACDQMVEDKQENLPESSVIEDGLTNTNNERKKKKNKKRSS